MLIMKAYKLKIFIGMLFFVILLGCALEPKSSTTNLKFNLPLARSGAITVHYLLYPYHESTAADDYNTFFMPIDNDHYTDSSLYIKAVSLSLNSTTDSYILPIEGLPPKRFRLRIHVYAEAASNRYYYGYDSSGTWMVTDVNSINFDDNGTGDHSEGIVFVYESSDYFDVIAGQTNSVNCYSVPYPGAM